MKWAQTPQKASLFLYGLLSLTLSQVPNLAKAQSQIQTIDDVNKSLISYGASWKAGSLIYFPSFYVGFAPKVENANRIEFRLGRGNVARLTATLDELTVLSYLYQMQARAELYSAAESQGVIKPVQQDQLGNFRAILASPQYQIAATIKGYQSGSLTRTQLYQKSFEIMKALNPGRVFENNTDLSKTILGWKKTNLESLKAEAAKGGTLTAGGAMAYLKANTPQALVAVNNILFGRVNALTLSEAQFQMLADVMVVADDASLIQKTVSLLKSATGDRYETKVVRKGQLRPALQCTSVQDCTLAHNEFTAVYPVGSVKYWEPDRDGNSIGAIREQGAMNFLSKSTFDVDQIRVDTFYGWAPKMNYSSIENAIHNPAVRTILTDAKYKELYGKFNIPANHDHLWVVARGAVSHGCTRMSLGHLLEVRQIFPSQPSEMLKLVYSGSKSADYDLFDIDGKGLKIMGVQYFIAYGLLGDSGLASRDNGGFSTYSLMPTEFRQQLYGKKQFTISGDKYIFSNPYVSYFNGHKKGEEGRASVFSVKMAGDFELYEQAYEKDKVQFFDLPKLSISSLAGNSNNKTNKSAQTVRLFGRIAACGPFASEFKECSEAAYKAEAKSLGFSL